MMVIDVVLCFNFDGFFVYVSVVFEEINPRKPQLVRYALDVDEIEFDLSQDPECYVFRCVKVGISFEFFFVLSCLRHVWLETRTLAFQYFPGLLLF